MRNEIHSTPYPYRFFFFAWLLYPLTLDDWVYIERLHDYAKHKNIAVTLFILQRAFRVGLFRALVLALIFWRRLPQLLDKIIEISTIHSKKPQADESAKKKSDSDGREIINCVRHLSIRYGWTPQQIGQMTMQQIQLYMAAGEDGTGVLRVDSSHMGKRR